MRARLLVLALSLAASWGCSPPEDPAARALREALTPVILGCKHVTLLQLIFVPDGGSATFHFKTDSGTDLLIQAGPDMDREIIRVSDQLGGNGFQLKHGSALERRILRLLESSRIKPAADPNLASRAPTAGSLTWLLDRIRDRSRPWTRVP